VTGEDFQVLTVCSGGRLGDSNQLRSRIVCRRVGIAAGVDLDRVRFCSLGGTNLVDFSVEKDADPDTGSVHLSREVFHG